MKQTELMSIMMIVAGGIIDFPPALYYTFL